MDGLDAETLAHLERMDRERRWMRWLVPLGVAAFLALIAVLAVQLRPDPASEPQAASLPETQPMGVDVAPIALEEYAQPVPTAAPPEDEPAEDPRAVPPPIAPVTTTTPIAKDPSPEPQGSSEDESPEAVIARLKLAAAPLVVDVTPFEALLNRPGTPSERTAVESLDKAGRVAWFLEQEDLYRAWFDDELEALGLTGVSRPLGPAWERVPKELAAGTLTPGGVVERLARSREFSARYVGARAFGSAILRLLGLDPSAPKRRADLHTAMRVYAGQAREFRGHPARNHLDLVTVAVGDDAFVPALVRRALLGVNGKAPDPGLVHRVVTDVTKAPQALFRARVEEALP